MRCQACLSRESDHWATPKYIYEQAMAKGVTLLIPARNDTKAFKLLFDYGSKITFISGRLRFNEASTAPFPSMIVRLCGGGYKKTKCELVSRERIEI